ncbi:replication-relaxation family protein [Streptosporangium saharense]|uniref:replication-relaxation family protein n=1 Tax=Streptosporangium saharense TaxID=1706840 RepID=UPI0036773144
MAGRNTNPALLALLAARLTTRDRDLLRAVWENRVLTTPQLTSLFFDSIHSAWKRLLTLSELGVVERFRPNLPPGAGSSPYYYVLGQPGAAVLASEDGVDLSAFGYRRDRALAIAYSQRLAHTVGVNDFYTDLVGFARRRTGAGLVSWWSERRCGAMWGDIVRPDGYGRWKEDNHKPLDFFLEHDTGTETLDRVVRKLDGYADLTEGSRIVTPVLFWVRGERRETNLRKRLREHSAARAVPVATACRSALVGRVDDGPAGELWLPLDAPGPRLRLARLALHWPDLGPRPPSSARPPEDTA